jgi:type IV secretory pathway VirB9-like protein
LVMKYVLPLMAGCAVLFPQQVFALDECKVSDSDPLTRICIYQPYQRYAVNGLVGFPVNLVFDPGETVKRTEPAYTGQDDNHRPARTWKGPKCSEKTGSGGADDGKCETDYVHNNLPIWPFQAGHSALVVVTASAANPERSYYFDLTARAPASDCEGDKNTGPGCSGDTTTTATLQFIQPPAPPSKAPKPSAASVTAWRAQQARKAEDSVAARLKVTGCDPRANFSYRAHGKAEYAYLAPSRICDDGAQTYMEWPGNLDVPAIAIVSPVTGEPQVVIPSVHGRIHVIDTTAALFRLSLGGKPVLDIENLAWKADRPDPQTGTMRNDVVRDIIYQDGKP